ncbi:MAG: M48 family metalloprotease [Armatimonadota bacterium]
MAQTSPNRNAQQSQDKAPPVPGLRADDFRVPNERTVLLQGAALTVAIAAALLLIVVLMGLRMSPVVGGIFIGVFAVWVIAPHAWLWVRARKLALSWTASALVMPPPTRRPPQTLAHDICLIIAANEPQVRLVPGKPTIASLPGVIYLTEELYQQTADRDLLMLLLHEIGHLYAGHLRLLSLARALPPEALEGWWQAVALAPALPWLHALREWALWADVTADRFALILKPDLDLALLGVMKQEVLCSPDSQSRTHLIRFLSTADGMLDRGERFLIGNEITDVLSERPELDTRISNLRAWKESEVFPVVTQHLRATLAARGKPS